MSIPIKPVYWSDFTDIDPPLEADPTRSEDIASPIILPTSSMPDWITE